MSLISNNFDSKQSSIGTLAKEKPHLDLITGRYSFGDFVEAVGIPAVPSSQNPKPGKIPFIVFGFCLILIISYSKNPSK